MMRNTFHVPMAITIGLFAFFSGAQARAAIEVASNPASITIPEFGAATPYPSTINIAATGTITDVNVSIFGFGHTQVFEVGALLVGPAGQNVVLFNFVGTGSVTGVDWTFDDGAASELPDIGSPPSGTYRPTNLANDVFPAPAPGMPYGSDLSVFNGTDLAGTWSLYVSDFVSSDSGGIEGGWSLSITYEDGTPGEVPEPASVLAWSLLGATTLGIIKIRKRRSRG